MKRILDNGIVQITLDNQRWYYHPEKEIYVPSATWILNYYPKGEGFKRWLASKVESWETSQRIVSDAAERGSMVHTGLEMLMSGITIKHDSVINNRQLTIEEYRYILSAVPFLRRTTPLVQSIEQTIWGKDDLYAGTVDLILSIDPGTLKRDGRNRLVDPKKIKLTGKREAWLIDIKTSAAIYPTHELQVAAYAMSPEVNVDRVGILKLGDIRRKDGYEFKEVFDIKEKYKVFLATRKIWEAENPQAKPRQIYIPQEIKLWDMYHPIKEENEKGNIDSEVSRKIP